MIPRISGEIWERLAGERPSAEKLWARFAAPDISRRLIAALDGEARRHFLVLLNTNEESLQDVQSRGLSVATRELAVPHHEAGRYLDITCHETTGHDAFDLIGTEIADRLANGRESAPEIVARVLAKWRRFWAGASQKQLSFNEQLGLFAELWFLYVWLTPHIGIPEAVNRWRGPSGSRHDFEWQNDSVEVKATSSTRSKIHRIHGLDQLRPPENGKLYFYSIRLREEGGAENSLPSLVAKCRSALTDDAAALNQFEATLAKAGYSPIHETEYECLRLRIVEEGLYLVASDFPRITSELFLQGLPLGVSYVEYEINLDGFSHLLVTKSPTMLSLG